MKTIPHPLEEARVHCAQIRTAIQRELPPPQKMALKVVEDVHRTITQAMRSRTLRRDEFEKLRDLTRALRTFGFSEETKLVVDRLQQDFRTAFGQRRAA